MHVFAHALLEDQMRLEMKLEMLLVSRRHLQSARDDFIFRTRFWENALREVLQRLCGN